MRRYGKGSVGWADSNVGDVLKVCAMLTSSQHTFLTTDKV
jgi:hypothetical protein